MQKSNFRDWTLDKIDEAFGLRFNLENATLSAWLSMPYTCSEYEQRYLLQLQKHLLLAGDAWNEVELENKFISPVFMFADIDNQEFAYFLERDLNAVIGEYELSGRVDGMIATGFRNPKKPFFCLAEYKKQYPPLSPQIGGIEGGGDPAAQCLIAMLVAQGLNDNLFPVYGCYIIGKVWSFMILEEKKYTISKFYNSDDEEIFDIYRILKGLKQIIENQLSKK